MRMHNQFEAVWLNCSELNNFLGCLFSRLNKSAFTTTLSWIFFLIRRRVSLAVLARAWVDLSWQARGAAGYVI